MPLAGIPMKHWEGRQGARWAVPSQGRLNFCLSSLITAIRLTGCGEDPCSSMSVPEQGPSDRCPRQPVQAPPFGSEAHFVMHKNPEWAEGLQGSQLGTTSGRQSGPRCCLWPL